ncbi:hypothetical protein OIU76_008865 [Salix suchowensis]|nr:hypothetical protein OIU76_008865 [Salix suchowensis]
MALSQLPKFTHCPPSLYTHINLPLFTKIKLPTLSRLKSTLTTTEPIPITEAHNFLTPQEETQTQFSLDKLFIPPDTEFSINESNGPSARILKGSNIVLSKYARDAQVVQADFIKSSVRTEDCPSDGKTQCINHFKVNDSWYLVDLPGYGYASAPQELRKDWNKFTKDYFLSRSTLVSVFLLIDASIPAKKIDLEYASWLGQNQVPMTLIFTKCDKRKKKRNGGKRPEENVNEFQELIRGFFETAPPWIMTSGVTNQDYRRALTSSQNSIEVYKKNTLEGRAGQAERFTIQYALCPCSSDERAVLEWL